MRLDNIDQIASKRIRDAFELETVALKHPLPERPLRMLGLVHIDGEVSCSAELSRALILKTTVALVRGVRSVFLSPRVALNLPIFSSETILMGDKRYFLVDIQRRGGYEGHDDTALYDRLLDIQKRYPDLFAHPQSLSGEIAKTFSKAFCYVKIPDSLDEQALGLFHEYLDIFIDLVKQTRPLDGDGLARAQADYEAYMDTLIKNDPAVKIYKMFFGAKGGIERALDMFFGR